MQLFYQENLTPATKLFEISQNEAKHITKVLRSRAGENLIFTDGKGYKYYCKLNSTNAKSTTAIVEKVEKIDNLPYELQIAIAPTKNANRIEFFVEKAVEIGITSITPLICRYSERKKINFERLEKIIVAAMKQSLKFYKPKLNQVISFNEFINQDFKDYNKFIALCESKDSIFNLKTKIKKYIFVIGPEGGFDSNEIELAKNNGFMPVKFNNYRLRIETAGIYAAVIANLLNLSE